MELLAIEGFAVGKIKNQGIGKKIVPVRFEHTRCETNFLDTPVWKILREPRRQRDGLAAPPFRNFVGDFDRRVLGLRGRDPHAQQQNEQNP